MWKDVLQWYRNSKRDFVVWQVEHYQKLVNQFYPANSRPRLIILVPGYEVTETEWNEAVRTGAGDDTVMKMPDNAFLMDLAFQKGLDIQYTSLQDMPFLENIQKYNSAMNYNLRVWGENAANLGSPLALANDVLSNNVYGMDYVNSFTLFQTDDTTTPTPYLNELVLANHGLARAWLGAAPTGFRFSPPDQNAVNLILTLGHCIYSDSSQTRTLCMQEDGNIVLSQGATQLWSTNLQVKPNCVTGVPWISGCFAVFDSNGIFWAYNGSVPYWGAPNSGQLGDPKGSVFQTSMTEPYLQVLDSSGDLLWSSSTNFSYGRFRLKQNQFIRFGPNADHYLTLSSTGSLLILQGSSFASANNLIWSSNTPQNCTGQCEAKLQLDGNLVLENGGISYWGSGTSTNEEIAHHFPLVDHLDVSTSAPNLSLISANGAVVWTH